MTLSRIGRFGMAFVVSVAMGLGMTACGGGTIGYMWVMGTQYNQIVGFKIDDFTGNLTTAVHSPFAAGGTNPVAAVIKPGGRYLYVINKGAPTTSTSTVPAVTGSGISVFSVGGDGSLTYQTQYSSQGSTPVWAASDSGGNYLYVLDQYSQTYGTTITNSDGTTSIDHS